MTRFVVVNFFLLGLFFSLQSLCDLARDVFHFQWHEGSRWVVLECVSDDIIHVKSYETRAPIGPNPNKALWRSPMIDSKFNTRFSGAKFCNITNNKHDQIYQIETKNLLINLNNNHRCLHITDKKNNKILTTICTERLDKNIKRLFFEKIDTRDIYGVGSLFINGKNTDGNWINQHWNAHIRGHGNFRFGQAIKDNFYGGAPSVSQFPMIYALQNNMSSFGVLLDHIHKVGWDFRDKRFDDNANSLRGWHADIWDQPPHFFIIRGDSLKEIKHKYHKLTGFPPVPPKSIFGHATSEFGFNSWQEIKQEINKLEKAHMPLDIINLDLQWFGLKFKPHKNGRFMGNLKFHEGPSIGQDAGSFPEPEKNIKNLFDSHGVVFMPIEESYVDGTDTRKDFVALSNPLERKKLSGFNNFEFEPYRDSYLARVNNYAAPTDVPFETTWVTEDFRFKGEIDHQVWWGGGGMIDWTNPDARKYWHQLKRNHYAKLGIFSFWLDLGEPEMYWQGSKYHGLAGLKLNNHPSIHNIYNLLWAKGIIEGFDFNHTEMTTALNNLRNTNFIYRPRVFTMSRAGTIGSHRYGAMWSGDTFSNFENLRAQMQVQTNMSLLGMDFYSSDTGGFMHGDRAKTPHNNYEKEIVTKWAAYASLVEAPIRTHAWSLGEDWRDPKNIKNDQSYSLASRGDINSNRANLYRRYELIPYVYSLAHRAHRTGEPIYPPLVYYFQEQHSLRKINNLKLIGDSLLAVMPTSYEEYQTSFVLPKGQWYDFENNKLYHGRKQIGPIDFYRKERLGTGFFGKEKYFMPPLFAKAGAIIPKMFVDTKTMNAHNKRRDGSIRDELIIRVYASSKLSQFRLYEDDGLTIAYKKNPKKHIRTTDIFQQSDKQTSFITISPAQGNFTGATQSRAIKLEFVTQQKKLKNVSVNSIICKQIKSPNNKNYSDYCLFNSPENNLIIIKTKKLPVHKEKIFKLNFD